MASASHVSRQFLYALKESGRSLWRAGFMSTIVTMSMVVALCLFGGLWLFVKVIHYFAERINSQLQVVVFLTNQANPDIISAKIDKLEGVISTTQISKQQAKMTMTEEIPAISELLKEENPFPDTIEVMVSHPGKMESVVGQIQEIPGVEEIQYNQELADHLKEVEQMVKMIGVTLSSILIIATFAIMLNTLHLTIHSRRHEIEIMRLVGASNWFIRMPFLLEGLFFGLASSAVAVIILVVWRIFTLSQVKQLFQFMPIPSDYHSLLQVIGWVVPMGITMGAIGSVISIHRYLRFEKALK